MKKTLLAAILCMAAIPGAHAQGDATINAIDMGLSVDWADRYLSSGLTEYDWASYCWGSPEASTNLSTTHDFGSSICGTNYDPATARLGIGWRMPTKAECEELVALQVAAVDAPQKGTLFTAANGNTLFFKAQSGYDGEFWSGDANNSAMLSPEMGAWIVSISSGKAIVKRKGRSASIMSVAVRPVQVKTQAGIKVQSVTLSETEVSMLEGADMIVWSTTLPENADNRWLNWSSDNTGVATVDAVGRIHAVAAGSTIVKATATDGSGIEATVAVTVTPLPQKNVDMGLSVEWGSRNIGAESAEEKGNYYRWGETKTASVYYEMDYFRVLPVTNLAGNIQYDAATKEWGEDWHTPSQAEWQELIDNCDMEQTADGSVKLTSRINGNSILLPATGYKSYGSVREQNIPYYMTSEAQSNYPSSAYIAKLSGTTLELIKMSPWQGYPVRAVRAVPAVEATAIELDRTSASLVIGDKTTLTATVLPTDATDKTVTWTTSDATIATVDENGVVTAVSVGKATITATCGAVSATCEITVTPKEATAIELDRTSASLVIGDKTTLTATVQPSDTTDPTVTWTTSDATVATVDENGVVTAVSVGKATITATCGSVSATCEITVTPKEATAIELDRTSASLVIGDKTTLTATVQPSDVTDPTVTWTTSAATIATVDENGVVTAVSVGKATITATCGAVSATCEITVTPKEATAIELDRTSASLVIGDKTTLTATVQPSDTTDPTVTWTTSDATVATVDENGVVTAVSVGKATITASCGAVSATCEITVTPKESAEVTAIDMGLRVEWGSINIGAESATDAGNYYRWGETQTTAIYYEDDYFSKLPVSDLAGTEYDAATKELGEDWHTPSQAEWQELIDNCDIEKTADGSVKFTSRINGNSIFLPATGYMELFETVKENDVPYYMTSDAESQNSCTAYIAKLSDTASEFVAMYAWRGYPVRAVHAVVIEATGIELSHTSATLVAGESLTLAATVLPSNATEPVTWNSSDASVATVDENGVVEALAAGTATITVSCGAVSDTCEITVTANMAISEIMANGVTVADIYDIYGRKVLSDATIDEIKALPRGIYVLKCATGTIKLCL